MHQLRLIRRRNLETRVLDTLQHHLMDPEAVWTFCEEYAGKRDRPRSATDAGRVGLDAKLRQVPRDHASLVDAIVACVPAEQVKERTTGLESRRVEIAALLQAASAADPVRFPPAMAATYRDRVGALIRELTASSDMKESKEALRSLVETIVLTPDPYGARTC